MKIPHCFPVLDFDGLSQSWPKRHCQTSYLLFQDKAN